jgi:eukaryotic-like serine/threonine-protein kinase
MDPERWRQIEKIFGTAIEHPAAERHLVVSKACGDDDDLKQEVLSLLDSADTSNDYFAELAGRTGVPAANDDGERLVGRTVGNYRLVQLLGRGGMGIVFLAARDDHQFEKEVALKLLPLGMGTGEGQQRFLQERQILAQLEHPGIARLLDGGVADDGTPYYVMEYVEGVPIDEYCDRHRQTVPARLELFIQVCEAVEHAHRHFVVHRDLKPGNILVTQSGEVKLLDFGIARMLDRHAQDAESTLSRRARPMTLAYASPEQVRGEAITTASDVYALGVLLYKLLAGVHPYRKEYRSPSDAEQVICGEEPTLPSVRLSGVPENERAALVDARATTAQRLKREIAGDLDTIVLMALRKEPTRRYATVGLLADDLQRQTAGLPVSAHRDSFGYRLSRFARRNRLAVAGGTVVALLVIALMVVSIRYTMTTAAQQRALTQEAETTQQVSDFLVDLFKFAEPNEGLGDTVSARALLDQGIDQLTSNAGDRPEVRASTMSVLAEAYRNLGLYDEAALLHEQALELRRTSYNAPHSDVAESLEQLAQTHLDAREVEAALPLYEEALAIRRQLSHEPLAIAQTLLGMARTLRDLGLADSAEALTRGALATRRTELGDGHFQTLWAMLDLAYVLRAQEELDSAQVLYEAVIPQLELHGDSGARLQPSALNNLAYVHMNRGEYAEAERLYRDAIPLEQEWGTVPNALILMNNLAGVLDRQDKMVETGDVLLQALQAAEVHWPNGHWRVGGANRALGLWNLRTGNAENAESLLRTALRVYRSTVGDDRNATAMIKIDLARCLMESAQFAEAEDFLTDAHDWTRAVNGIDDRLTQTALTQLVELYEAWGRPEQATQYRSLVRSPG